MAAKKKTGWEKTDRKKTDKKVTDKEMTGLPDGWKMNRQTTNW